MPPLGRRRRVKLDIKCAIGTCNPSDRVERAAIYRRHECCLRIAPICLQLTGHNPFDLGLLLVGHYPTLDEKIGNWLCRFRDPIRISFSQTVGIDRAILDRKSVV